MSSASKKKFRVLYVTGSGRSGSTIFDIALGSSPDICAVGELYNLPRAGWINGEVCACGSPVPECEFWCRVRSRWQEIAQGATAEDLARLQDVVETNAELIRRVPRMARDQPGEYREYAHLVTGLYSAISDVSGKSVIVDSTKSPKRAMALLRVPNLDIRYIHLVRDVRGVAWSLKKAFRKNFGGGVQKDIAPRAMIRTVAFWVVINSLAELVLSRAATQTTCRLRYEDFVGSPSGALQPIEELADLDLSALSETLEEGGALVPGHTVAGNRVRTQSKISLRIDDEWLRSLTKTERTGIWLLAAPLLSRYGYSR